MAAVHVAEEQRDTDRQTEDRQAGKQTDRQMDQCSVEHPILGQYVHLKIVPSADMIPRFWANVCVR